MNQAEMGRLGVPLVLREWSLLERAWRRPGCALRGQMGGAVFPSIQYPVPPPCPTPGGTPVCPLGLFSPHRAHPCGDEPREGQSTRSPDLTIPSWRPFQLCKHNGRVCPGPFQLLWWTGRLLHSRASFLTVWRLTV